MRPGEQIEDDAVALLLRAAGRREAPPEEARRRVWLAVEETWRARLRRRRQRRAGAWLAVAASVVVALVVLYEPGAPTPAIALAGRVDRVVGTVESRPPAEAWRPLGGQAGAGLVAGSLVRTAEGGLAGLILEGGVSLRLAGSTEIRVEDRQRVRLVRGTVYLDTGPAGERGPVEIVTPDGVAQDFGTQFEVRHADGILRLRVREGRVVLARADERLVADAGEELAVRTGGAVARGVIAADDPEWRWVESVAPAPQVDQRPVRVLLDWAARETGRRLSYADAAAAGAAEETVLYGRVGPVAPLEALEVLLATTDLNYVLLDDGTIEVRRR